MMNAISNVFGGDGEGFNRRCRELGIGPLELPPLPPVEASVERWRPTQAAEIANASRS